MDMCMEVEGIIGDERRRGLRSGWVVGGKGSGEG